MTQEERQVSIFLFDTQYITDLFNERIEKISDKGENIVRLKMIVYKKHFEERFFHYIVRYDVTIKLKNGLCQRGEIFGISFSKHGRKKMFKVMTLIYNNGFNKGKAVIPKPLWYEDKLMTVFYMGVPGDNLLDYFKNGHESKDIIKKIAQAIRIIHQTVIKRDIKIERHKFSLRNLDITDILARQYNKRTTLAKNVLKQLAELKNVYREVIVDEKFVLSHGDFHPENIIVNKFNSRQLAIIDFSESCLSPFYYDIASWLQQFNFMTKNYLSAQKQEAVEEFFLKCYFEDKKISLRDRNKINLYKAWTALKSAVYVMVFKEEARRTHAEYLLKKSKEYQEKIILNQ